MITIQSTNNFFKYTYRSVNGKCFKKLEIQHFYVNFIQAGDGQTIPPPRATYSAQVHQWGIYDALQEDFDRQEKLREDKTKKKPKKQRKKEIDKQDIINRKMFIALNVLERMINQNTYNDIAQGINSGYPALII